MLELDYKFDGTIKTSLEAKQAVLRDREGLHRAMAAGVSEGVTNHLAGLNSRSPNTNWYARAAESVEYDAAAEGAEIRVTKTGAALRLYGGTTTAGKSISSFTGKATRNQALPTKNVPVVGERRLSPREVGVLAFIPSRSGSIHTTGVLVEGVMQLIRRGKNKGMMRAVPKKDGRLMFVLSRLVTQQPDPTVIPSREQIAAAAVEGGSNFIASFEGGAS